MPFRLVSPVDLPLVERDGPATERLLLHGLAAPIVSACEVVANLP